MKWTELLDAVGSEPLFESGMLLVGEVDPTDVARQLSRWVAAGRLLRLRRGLYAFAGREAQLRRPLNPYEVANRLVPGSYVSLASVLAQAGLIPEYVPVTTSVTTGRPGMRSTPLGSFLYRRVKREMFWGYEARKVAPGVHLFVATPEKALVDMFYLESDADDPSFLSELRLQNLERVRLDVLATMAQRCGSARVVRAVDRVESMATEGGVR